MTIEGVDYSFSRPTGAALAQAGKHFAVRYLSSTSKGLTLTELQDLKLHGISIALVYESGAGRSLSGKAAGMVDAAAAADQIHKLGLPNLPVYFAVDFDASAIQQIQIDNYLAGIASVLGANRVGIYGSYGVIERCQQNKTATWFWQTYAWSHGMTAPGIHLYQYKNGQTINGASVDYCQALQLNYGQTILLPTLKEASMAINGKAFKVEWTVSGRGYWIFASDGGVFARGDAQFYGNLVGVKTNAPLSDAAITPSGRGYIFLDEMGEIYANGADGHAFGDAQYFGNAL